MKWTSEAEEAVSRVPFFVRRRVRKRVEEEASRANARSVTMEHVESCRKRFLKNMESEVKGYQVETCFGTGGCPNRVIEGEDLVGDLEKLLEQEGLRDFLKSVVDGPLKLHHEFRVTLSDCPNACSRPQIADVGIIAAAQPFVSPEPCSLCRACEEACLERAIVVPEEVDRPIIDYAKCVHCGQCARVCPTGTLEEEIVGYRIQLGGKLGRHPQLAHEILGIHTKNEVVQVIKKCLEHFKQHNRNGERFGEILNRTGFEFLNEQHLHGISHGRT